MALGLLIGLVLGAIFSGRLTALLASARQAVGA